MTTKAAARHSTRVGNRELTAGLGSPVLDAELIANCERYAALERAPERLKTAGISHRTGRQMDALIGPILQARAGTLEGLRARAVMILEHCPTLAADPSNPSLDLHEQFIAALLRDLVQEVV